MVYVIGKGLGRMKKRGMIDLHTHSLLSDGVLIPSELVCRAHDSGLECVAITDHADASNLEQVVEQILSVSSSLSGNVDICVIPGVEITYVPPPDISDAVQKARRAGAKLVLVHGETIVEPVPPGTDRAAIEAGVDILAHPGMIAPEEVKLACENSVCLEISGRKGHSLTNGRVAKLAEKFGARLVFGSDTHEPGDILSFDMAKKVCRGAGLSKDGVEKVFEDAWETVERIGVTPK